MEQIADFFQALLGHALERLAFPFAAGERIYFLYLITSLLIAYGAYRLAHRTLRPQEAFVRFFRFCFPKEIYGAASAKLDYLFFLINGLFFPLFFAPLIVSNVLVATGVQDLLGLAFGAMDAPLPVTWIVMVSFTIVLALIFDLSIFIAHYLQHRVAFLWEFHKVHHSAEVLTPMTVYRMHPIDDLLSGTLGGLLMGCVGGVFFYLYGPSVSFFALAGLNLFVFVFYVAGYHLRHSHIWLSYPKALSHILISPAQHQIHHSQLPIHHDRNLGFMLALWDWMAGTLYVPATREALVFGLDTEENLTSLPKLYLQPFKRAFALLTGGSVGDRSAEDTV